MKPFIAGKKYTPRELMERAYLKSLESIGEHKDKPDPLVGAIIATNDGQIIAEACRGELRIGEHCEYTLIERKLKSENLSDKVLYVTLEPCIDVVRTEPKRGCATHIIKSRIPKVYIGMRDPDIEIENHGANELMSAGVEVKAFDTDLSQKIRESLSDFIKYKEAEKLKLQKETKEAKSKEYFQESVSGSKIDEFSKSAIQLFLDNSKSEFSYPSEEFNQWAISFGLGFS